MGKTDIIVENNRTLREKVENASDELEAAKLKLSIIGDHDQNTSMPDHMNLEVIAGSIEK